MRTKGEVSVTSTTKELVGRVECKGEASQSELGLMRSLMGIRTEEATFTFSGVDWEAPFQRTSNKQVYIYYKIDGDLENQNLRKSIY